MSSATWLQSMSKAGPSDFTKTTQNLYATGHNLGPIGTSQGTTTIASAIPPDPTQTVQHGNNNNPSKLSTPTPWDSTTSNWFQLPWVPICKNNKVDYGWILQFLLQYKVVEMLCFMLIICTLNFMEWQKLWVDKCVTYGLQWVWMLTLTSKFTIYNQWSAFHYQVHWIDLAFVYLLRDANSKKV